MSTPKRNRARSLIELFQRTNSQEQTEIPATPSSPITSTIYQLLNDAGSFGLYQKVQFFLVGLLAVLPAMTAFSYVFIAATPEHRCQLNLTNFTDTFENQSIQHQNYINYYIPSSKKHRQCFIHIYEENFKGKNLTQCSKWVFSKTFYN